MEIAVTGHTSGIGKCLYERLSPNIIGFSLSNGYDITLKSDRLKILDAVENCNIFINNAPAGFAQTLLFLELYEKWKNLDKTIINVGSRIAEIFTLPESHRHLLQYQAEKLILKEMSLRVQGKCKVKYKWFAYVGTEKILQKYPNMTDYITENQAVDIILS